MKLNKLLQDYRISVDVSNIYKTNVKVYFDNLKNKNSYTINGNVLKKIEHYNNICDLNVDLEYVILK